MGILPKLRIATSQFQEAVHNPVLNCCRLVEEYPDRALSWFAVGCYYLCTHQHDKARRYFGKATTMENNFAAAWIGFGNAFAFQDESDQVCHCNAVGPSPMAELAS